MFDRPTIERLAQSAQKWLAAQQTKSPFNAVAEAAEAELIAAIASAHAQVGAAESADVVSYYGPGGDFHKPSLEAGPRDKR